MGEEESGGPVRHRTQVEVSNGRNAFHIGPGNQYVKFGGTWAQAVALIAGVAGASVGIAMAPDASRNQYVIYCALMILCVTVSVVCLWFACDGVNKKLTAFASLTVVAVAGAAFATGSYKLLADHGSLNMNLSIPVSSDGSVKGEGGGSMKDKEEVTVSFDAPSPRSYLRITLFIEDKVYGSTCDAHSSVSLGPTVNGGKMVTLEDGQTRDIYLSGRRKNVELRAVVDTSKGGTNCRVNLRFGSTVLHDNEWWLP